MSLRKSAVTGVKWTAASSLIMSLVHFIKMAILARLLVPDDFGLMAMVMVVLNFTERFSDMGISAAIIHKQDTTRQQLSSLYWVNVAMGFSIYMVILVCKPFIILFFGEPRLGPLVPLAALSLLINCFVMQFKVLMQKNLLFAGLSKIEMISASIGAAVAIVSGFMGQGVYSFIWGQLAQAFTQAVMLMNVGFKKWRPSFHLRTHHLKGYLSFGLFQMGERSINYISANMDYILIGRFLGSQALGLYRVAYELVITPMNKINPILTRVAFPVFAMKQDDNATICRGYLKMEKLIALVIFPLLAGLAVTAPVAVPAILGEGWEQSIVLIQVLSLLGILKALGNPAGSVLLAKGRADIGFYWNVMVLILNFLVFRIVIHLGLFALVTSYLGLTLLYFMTGWWIIRMIIGLKFLDFTRTLYPLFFMSGAMALAVHMISRQIQSFTPLVTLTLLVISGAVFFIGLLLVFEREFLRSIVRDFLSKEKTNARSNRNSS